MNTENLNTPHSALKRLNTLSTVLFYFSILFFIIGFNFSDVMVGNWYQQFMPSGLPNFQVSDLYFLDSLTGFAVTGNSSPNDSSGYILRTTNGGDNWILKFAEFRDFSRVKFINSNTGFVSGGYFNGARIYKTINGGENWSPMNIPGGGQIYFDDMSVLDENTIWVVASNSLVGGVFYTSNGGASWTPQLTLGPQNPNHIYMFNAQLGFICRDNNYLRRTTNGGQNWTVIPGASGFLDMYFANSLTGWKTSFQKTTDGGLNWVNQALPQGGNILISQIVRFDNIYSDTIWGVGSTIMTGIGNRGMICRTTNGGQNWLFQVPDSNINIFQYQHIDFTKPLNGWAYTGSTGVHTTAGGDPNWFTGIQKISDNVPKDFELNQNYPNPFNPRTVIPYGLKKAGYVRLIAYDILGKEVQRMVDNKLEAGEYEVDFMGKFTSTGVYFYLLIIDGKLIDTKKMILLK